jgi:TetR/AcrR family transcriptional regulator, transcriptional repressor for nem operon
MAWPSERKYQTRERMLQSAAQLFTQRGYDTVGINDVMAHAGLTRGAFYAHFASKAELYAEAIHTAAQMAYGRLTQQLPAQPSRAQIVDAYLSQQHRLGEAGSCPLAFLATDISHRDPAVRSAYTQVFKGFIDNVGSNPKARRKALEMAVLMIGGMAIARALNDEALVQELFSVCRDGARGDAAAPNAQQ